MKKLIKNAKGIIKLGLIEPSGNGYYDVDGQIVQLTKKSGRTTISCSCKSCSRFCNEPNICSRKLAVLLFESQDFKLKKLIRENMKTAEQHKEFDMKMEPDFMINLLNDLKRFIL